MNKAGAIISTFESFLFEILKDSNNPKFKLILPLIKESN